LLAKAYETSETVRGEGDAEGIKIYADAFGRDPEFYAFVRSLSTYEKAMSEESTIVLSTGSDFFRYLLTPGK
jgi:membrane protease subunit HflC